MLIKTCINPFKCYVYIITDVYVGVKAIRDRLSGFSNAKGADRSMAQLAKESAEIISRFNEACKTSKNIPLTPVEQRDQEAISDLAPIEAGPSRVLLLTTWWERRAERLGIKLE